VENETSATLEAQWAASHLADRYVRGEMTGVEREAYEESLFDDEVRLEAAETTVALQQGLDANRDGLADAGNRSAAAAESGHRRHPVAVLPWGVAASAIAALVVVSAALVAARQERAFDDLAIRAQALIDSGYRGAVTPGAPVTVTRPPSGLILLELPIPPSRDPAGGSGAAVIRLREAAGGRLVLERELHLSNGFGLVLVEASRIEPGEYELRVVDSESETELVSRRLNVVPAAQPPR
jgi:hypothetical protein